jgi:hypothetical protein
MPPQRTTSGLLAKYGAKIDQAVQQHAQDETNYGIINLPPGINNGVAQLISCKFDTYKSGNNTGEIYWQARGVAVEPDKVQTVNGPCQVRGLQTMVMEPIHATQNQDGSKITSVDEHVARVMNHMRMLAGDDFTAGVKTAADLEGLCDILNEAKPYFKFTTSPRFSMTEKNPDGSKLVTGAWENWHGNRGLEDWTPPDGSGQVVDESPPAPQPKPSTSTMSGIGTMKREVPAKTVPKPGGVKQPPAPPNPPVKTKVAAPGPEPEPTEDLSESVDLENLSLLADNGDEDAQKRLNELAKEAGIEQDAEGNLPGASWSELAGLIQQAEADQEQVEATPEEEAPVDDSPQVGQIWKYQVIDPKTKKPKMDLKTKKVQKPVECEIVFVHENGKVNLKNLDDGKTVYPGVPVDQLIGD